MACDTWISVKDELPAAPLFGLAWCLVYCDGVRVAFYAHEFGMWQLAANLPLFGVTHWQPLPEKPKCLQPTAPSAAK